MKNIDAIRAMDTGQMAEFMADNGFDPPLEFCKGCENYKDDDHDCPECSYNDDKRAWRAWLEREAEPKIKSMTPQHAVEPVYIVSPRNLDIIRPCVQAVRDEEEDLISRKAVTDAFIHLSISAIEGLAYKRIIDSLPPVKHKAQWIPVAERLPEAEKTVLICTARGTICCAIYEDGTVRECDSSWNWYDIDYAGWDEEEDCGIIPEGWWEHTMFHPDCEFDCAVDAAVVAWMPLPETWEGESQ